MMGWLKWVGRFSGVHSLLYHLFALVQTRVELFSIELQVALRRFLTAVILSLGLAAFCWLSVAILILGVLELVWDSDWRRPLIWILFGVAFLFFLAFCYALAQVVRKSTRPFGILLEELKKDVDAFQSMKR